jgi:hypothetical protein
MATSSGTIFWCLLFTAWLSAPASFCSAFGLLGVANAHYSRYKVLKQSQCRDKSKICIVIYASRSGVVLGENLRQFLQVVTVQPAPEMLKATFFLIVRILLLIGGIEPNPGPKHSSDCSERKQRRNNEKSKAWRRDDDGAFYAELRTALRSADKMLDMNPNQETFGNNPVDAGIPYRAGTFTAKQHERFCENMFSEWSKGAGVPWHYQKFFIMTSSKLIDQLKIRGKKI